MTDELAARARDMRNAPGEPEVRLWQRLRAAQLDGYKFRRQAVLGRFIVDFLCPAKALVVEIDGETHDAIRDDRRDAALLGLGFRTIRFTNADVMRNIEGVLQTILSTLNAMPDRWPRPHPNPSPEGEGLRNSLGAPEGERLLTSSCPSSSEEGLGW